MYYIVKNVASLITMSSENHSLKLYSYRVKCFYSLIHLKYSETYHNVMNVGS